MKHLLIALTLVIGLASLASTQSITRAFALGPNFGLRASAVQLLQMTELAGTTGVEMNVNAATLGTCTAGTITTGSRAVAGGYTGNTSGSCIVNFTTSFTNAPFCIAMSIASTTHPRVSATAVGSITITGGVSGEAITWHCFGRI